MVKDVGIGIKDTLNEKIRFGTITKALLLSYIITIPTFMIFALILSYTTFPEKFMSTAVIITTLISLLVAGSYTTRGLKSKGWLNGAVSGFLYMVVLYLISSILFKNFAIDKYVVTMLLIGILTGAIGGIVGINIKSTPSKKKTKVKAMIKSTKK